MNALILALLLQFPSNDGTVPPKTCTVVGLGLPTTSLTEYQVRTLAKEKWGSLSYTNWLRLNNARYSIVMVGFRTLFDGDRDPEGCPAFRCWSNRQGSWRRLWNSILIEECTRQQANRK